jgi:caa(3)-type oxidase subunit IV
MAEHTALPETTTNHDGHDAKPHPTEGLYFSIFVVLAVLTLFELIVVYLPGVRVPLLLGIATAKAVLVVQYYMHLRYEARILRYVFLFPVISGALVTVLLQPLIQ